jgi:exopolysaccharide biosynthesis polyprenyl glycosylphosphotransferase
MYSEELLKDIENRLNHHIFDLILKRIADIVISIILIILLLPVMIIIGIVIKLDSKGPVIFTQKRVGLRGKKFIIYKFRTMIKNAEELFKLNLEKDEIGSFIFQDKGDSRITKVGAYLRKSSLDELPQLINVLIGNMSLIGPRPEIPVLADLYNDMQKLRLCMKPGITGLAQVSGRGEIELDKTIEYDLQYINTFSIWLDMKILYRTFSVVFKREGAY